MGEQDVWLLITAHPDDESMFFLPTLRNLENRTHGHILCLSTGDFGSSDGKIRTKELQIACELIGWGCTVVDDDRLKDGPNEIWNSDVIADQILECIKLSVVGKATDIDTKENDMAKLNLNILTFDNKGVSSHPNHIDTFKGARHLLEEKARHTGNDNAINSQLIISVDNKVIPINTHVWTLQTISNPLHKYFLWSVWELLPQVILLLFQLFWQLALFLLGSSLWSKSKVTFDTPLTGMRQTSTTTRQFRIMEPILAWNAMAAHYSQFVWYRRLSIMFSRYTFINNLVKLQPDTSLLVHEEESTLPPISIIKEIEPKFLIDTTQMNIIREKILPSSMQLRPWKRIYSLARDGDSFISFQQRVGEWNSKNKSQHSTLLVIKTTQGEVFGGYTDVPFVQTVKHPSGGAAGTCLFKVLESDVAVYGKSNGGNKRVVLDPTRRMVAFGGGMSSDEGEEDGFGLCLSDGFVRGTTARCEAFGNAPLVDDGGVFEVTDVEVWGFVFGQL